MVKNQIYVTDRRVNANICVHLRLSAFICVQKSFFQFAGSALGSIAPCYN
ncbi:hypothetical protein ACE1CA_15990 [Aerosakkonemataceae cyanobacterium BLCC-F167]|uniref:Uncharacterized protein n=1 Tax=Floridaenema evergladense BLCC-F167 TaxID=3153639 RepID=A0ABV4WLR7_9CYAN